MTNQEAIDISQFQLNRQGERCTNVSGTCQYKKLDGSKILHCAIGFLLSDDIYTSGMEGSDVEMLNRYMENEGIENPLKNIDTNLLNEMQEAHDDSCYNEREPGTSEASDEIWMSLLNKTFKGIRSKFNLTPYDPKLVPTND